MFFWVWTQLGAIFLKDLGQLVGGGGGVFIFVYKHPQKYCIMLNFSVYKNISSQE